VSLDVLIVSGIWPPDVGGPATHGPDLGTFLVSRGDRVRAVTTAHGKPAPERFPVRALPREVALFRRMAEGAAVIRGSCRDVDVIYATGMYARSAAAARAADLPLVIKLANDPAFERARSLGLFSGSLEEFQVQRRAAPRIRALRLLRSRTLQQANRIVVPSKYLAGIAEGWGIEQERLRVIPNPAPAPNGMASRDELRRRLGLEGPTLVFAGRFVQQKDLPLAVAALRQAPAATLVLVGDGPERATIEMAVDQHGLRERVRFVAAVDRRGAMEWMRAADAVVLPSAWENFPHAAVEALAVGTPVIATAVGGVPEIIADGHNGVLVRPQDTQALGAAMAALTRSEALRDRLRRGAEDSGGRFTREATFDRIRSVLAESVGERPKRQRHAALTITPIGDGLDASSGPRWTLIADLVGPAPESVLDVGCRDRALQAYLPDGTRYVGVDILPPADVVASAEEPLPFQDRSFDVVVFADVLEHLNNPHGALDEGMRIARRGVVVLLPNLYTAWNRLHFVRGRLYTQKYMLDVEPTVDRHRWFLRYDEGRAFVRGRAVRAGWGVSRETAHTPAFRHPGMRATYWIARRAGGPNLWAWEYAARLEPTGPGA